MINLNDKIDDKNSILEKAKQLCLEDGMNNISEKVLSDTITKIYNEENQKFHKEIIE